MNENEEFLRKYEKYKPLIENAGHIYSYILSDDELASCYLVGLWNALRTYKDNYGTKLESHVVNHVKWECLGALNEVKPEDKRGYILFGASGQCETDYLFFDLEDESGILHQRFVERLTYREMGRKNGYSQETARRRTQNILEKAKILLSD